MENLAIIADGWAKFIKSFGDKFPNSNQELAIKRSNICKHCPELVKTSGVLAKLWAQQCKVCGCAFPVIVYSRYKTCPLEKW